MTVFQGLVTGVSAGVTSITYYTGVCYVSTTITVNPAPAAITGGSTVCIGSTLALSDATPGGTWMSSNPSKATVSSTGVVTGVAAGVVTIYYSMGSGCSVSKTITVNAAPYAISGPSGTCIGSTITLLDSISGGVWTSSNTFVATIGSATGIVTGLHAGTTMITYSIGGCSVTKTLTISAAPAAITGSSSLCAGTTITLADATAGGTWSTSNPAVATVSTTGVVAGVAAGIVNIYYTVGGCSVSKTVTVTAGPAAISGSSTACIGSATVLTDAVPGGVWTSGSPAIASVGATTGIVTGLAAGVVNIYYTIGSCSVSKTMTVSAAPKPITGSSAVCVGTTITLADIVTGGVWSSSSPAIATVSASGTVTGMSAGVVTISYSVGGCFATKSVTVNAAPGAITGSSTVCIGSTITLSDPTPGGTWLSSNPLVATVTSTTGVVTGVASGFIVAYYSVGGCSVYKVVSVNPSPKAITGPSSLCAGTSITLVDATPGGIWISANIAIATVSPTGMVTGISAGLTTISYMAGGCSATKAITVNPCGKIGGVVTTGAGRGTTAAIPVGGIVVELLDAETRALVAQTNTDATGTYEFTELGYGSYVVNPKENGFTTIPSSDVAMTKTSLDVENVNFVKNNGDKTIAPRSAAEATIVATAKAGLSVYPNPSNGDINITWDNQPTGTAGIVVTSIIGTEVYKGTINMNTAAGQSHIDLSSMKSGIYLITIKSDNISFSTKLFIQQ